MKAVKVGDIGTEHDGFHPTKVTAGSGDVFIDGVPAARVGDPLEPHDKPKNPPHGRVIATGSSTVFINGRPAGITGGAISCGGVTIGSGTVNIGDVAPPEVPLSVQELPKKKGYKTEVINATPATATFTPKIIYIPIDDEGNNRALTEEEIADELLAEESLIETAAGESEDTDEKRKFKITDIPDVMRTKHHWPKSAELMKLWFSLPAREMIIDEKEGNIPATSLPQQYVNTTMFSWDWLEQFDRVKSAQKELLRRIHTPKAYSVINRRIDTFLSRNGNQNIPEALEFTVDPIELHSTSQFQYTEVGFGKMDDLYGSLGNFSICAAITRCSLKPLKGSHVKYKIIVHEIGLYMRDTYDFIGDQYLGHWCDEGLKLELIGGMRNIAEGIDDKFKFDLINEYNDSGPTDSKGNPIEAFGNSDFNQYRTQYQKGGDLLLFSNIKKIPVNFTVDTMLARFNHRQGFVL